MVKAIISITKIIGRAFAKSNNPRSLISLVRHGLLDTKVSSNHEDPLNPNPLL
jgi:hypothetical protein